MRTPALYMKYSLSEVHKTVLITTYLQVYFFCEQILNERHVGQSTHASFSSPEPLGLICNRPVALDATENTNFFIG